MQIALRVGTFLANNAAGICTLTGLVGSIPFLGSLVAAAGIILGSLLFGLRVQSIVDRYQRRYLGDRQG